MIFLDVSFQQPDDNLLYDEVLLDRADKQLPTEALRLWESPVYFVVLGRLGRINEECCLDVVRQDKIRVCRRASGGGTVVQGPGCLNFSLILDRERDLALRNIRSSYEWISERIIRLLKNLGIEAGFFPVSDLGLLSNCKKFSGNAQKRGRRFILHHGTILYDFNLEQISRYLQHPADRPEWRKNRPHQDFVTNLSGLNSSILKEAFYQAFGCFAQRTQMTAEEAVDLQEMKNYKEVFIDIQNELP